MDYRKDDIDEVEELIEAENTSASFLLQTDELKKLFASLRLPEYWTKDRSPFQPFILLDRHLRIQWYNQPMAEIFTVERLEQSENLSRLMNLKLENEHHKNFLQDIQKETMHFCRKEYLNVHLPHRGLCHLLLIMLPILEGDKHPQYYLALVEDHTLEQKKLINRTFQSLLEASLLKDNDTGKHVQRVNLYCKAIAEELLKRNRLEQYTHFFIEDISYLAAMHDVGKIGTPDDILNKKGPLEEWEMMIMREHTTNGAFILNNYPNPMAREIALNHHENWDGSGYPYAKQGEMIPLSARIVALADVYDALRSKRSYKEAWPHQKTCDEMISLSGSKFDPGLVRLFKEIHLQFSDIWDSEQDAQSGQDSSVLFH